jgi:hypothetical protein
MMRLLLRGDDSDCYGRYGPRYGHLVTEGSQDVGHTTKGTEVLYATVTFIDAIRTSRLMLQARSKFYLQCSRSTYHTAYHIT